MLDAIYIPDDDSIPTLDIKSKLQKLPSIIKSDIKSSISPKLNTTTREHQQITFSIFEFKHFTAQQIAQYRHSLFCPECLQIAYFRRASKDGKQACFGSRHHLPNCSELSKVTKKASVDLSSDLNNDLNEEVSVTSEPNGEALIDESIKQRIEVKDNKIVEENLKQNIKQSVIEITKSVENSDEGFFIDFSAVNKNIRAKNTHVIESQKNTVNKDKTENNNGLTDSKSTALISENSNKSIKQTLPKLLKSLLNNSSLASSNVWVHTSEKHKWRAKNLFVNFSDAEVLENLSPRMYWGAINNADKELLWLNVADAKNVAIPIKLFRQDFLDKYSINKNHDLAGANIILFAKCLTNKDKSRKFLQLWSNDLQYLHLSLPSL
ncbi:hypothetical protein [Psychromonas sp. SP041]|uniref:hypothetical protein n=1 Tax=Psychromonas sp. SP041 TaxID=1365007 RepID=UPI000411EB2E|nr:hypothetical protein [Psychromonas sp. SP041]